MSLWRARWSVCHTRGKMSWWCSVIPCMHWLLLFPWFNSLENCVVSTALWMHVSSQSMKESPWEFLIEFLLVMLLPSLFYLFVSILFFCDSVSRTRRIKFWPFTGTHPCFRRWTEPEPAQGTNYEQAGIEDLAMVSQSQSHDICKHCIPNA